MPPAPASSEKAVIEPLKRLAAASKACSVQSLAYGTCVGKSYLDVQKGMCEEEFRVFKDCVQKNMGRKW